MALSVAFICPSLLYVRCHSPYLPELTLGRRTGDLITRYTHPPNKSCNFPSKDTQSTQFTQKAVINGIVPATHNLAQKSVVIFEGKKGETHA